MIRTSKLAVDLMNYIKKRAVVENVKFDLPLSLFHTCVVNRASPVFGVHHDGRRMLRDDQEPYEGFFLKNNGQR